MSESNPPPIYSKEDPDQGASSQTRIPEPQVLIIPTGDSMNFQKGFLGAEGERATVEGELQLKGFAPEYWQKITMVLQTKETAFENEIHLSDSESVLFCRDSSQFSVPASLHFAIPIMRDAPQPIQTPYSSLTHTLTATLCPVDHSQPPLIKTHRVHTRRYTSHNHILPISPQTHVLSDPTQVKIELPRVEFTAGEPIPIYVSVPPPDRTTVERGLRLRNVRAELVRSVYVKRSLEDEEPIPLFNDHPDTSTLISNPSTSQPSSSKAPTSPSAQNPSFRTIVSRSGAQCRFHASRKVQLRLLLRQASPTGSPSDVPTSLASSDEHLTSDAECPSITQITLLHSVTFRANIHVAFVDMTNRTEQVLPVSIPITIVPSPAPLPEVSATIDAAYQKKHDRPPVKTNRLEDLDNSIPLYEEGQAGPSGPPAGAPPPFEERDAPPPFGLDEPSSSSRLPTFLESESEIIIPDTSVDLNQAPPPLFPIILGEGSQFGFSPADQFDGHSEELRSSTPPPTLEEATLDTDVTILADMSAEHSIEALGLVLDGQEDTTLGERPPPPPAMDDPSDPPPSIDSDFRAPDVLPPHPPSPHPSPPPHPPPHPPYATEDHQSMEAPAPSAASLVSPGHAPPPYLVPDNQELVARPPPYVD